MVIRGRANLHATAAFKRWSMGSESGCRLLRVAWFALGASSSQHGDAQPRSVERYTPWGGAAAAPRPLHRLMMVGGWLCELDQWLNDLTYMYPVISLCIRLRPYSVKSTVSRPNCAVKPLQALSVLRWGTTWESGVP
jgi:hypothetical protein